ncbi:pentatricopeptide repeat-containing protein At2g17525, mitochondrial [Rutidosis leptorrhynchoides]|uniref:pentatricopeptide repeat-containing protein At2g17525, mitochondrial n=1 Tax=Rutidosis leptorrhynchoides TaxID=125765 RepID=UPI003A98DFFC
MLNSLNYFKNLPILFRSKNNQSRFISSTTPVPTHDHISHLILDQKSASEALHTFRWASKLPHFIHSQSTYRALVHKLCTFRHFDTVHQVLDEMPSSIGSPPNDDIFITIVRGLGRARMIRQVTKVLDLVSRFNVTPTLKIYNSILDVLVKEDIDIARGFYRRKMMGCGVEGDMYTFGILMKGLCLTNRIADGFKLLQTMKIKGVTPNTVIYNTLIHALCKNGKLGIGRARSLMNEMVDPNNVTFNILITAYCKEDNLIQALVMLEKSFNLGFVPDVITITKVVEILCSKDRAMEAVEVLERVENKGGTIDVVAYNTLVKGFCNLKKAKVARRFLKEMELKGCLPNVYTYNALISGFCELGLLDSALDMFDEMKTAGISWNFVTFDTLVCGLCSGGRIEDGYKIMELMEESKSGSVGHISPYNSMLYGLYKANRNDEALDFLKKMGMKFPRAVDKSRQILQFCEEGRIEDAKKTYDQMIQEGSVPSVFVYTALIKRLCDEKLVKEALEMTNDMLSGGYVPNATMLNALVETLCEEGKLGSALKLVEDMVGRGCLIDSGSYSALICAFCERGDIHRCLMLFMEMVEKGNVPSYVLWNTVVDCLAKESVLFKSNNLCFVNDMLDCILKT